MKAIFKKALGAVGPKRKEIKNNRSGEDEGDGLGEAMEMEMKKKTVKKEEKGRRCWVLFFFL